MIKQNEVHTYSLHGSLTLQKGIGVMESCSIFIFPFMETYLHHYSHFLRALLLLHKPFEIRETAQVHSYSWVFGYQMPFSFS